MRFSPKVFLNLLPVAASLVLGFMMWNQYRGTQAASRPTGTMPQSERWQVVNVADGDTLTVGSRGKTEKLRLCGINAPEIAHGSKPGQPFGNEATEKLKSLHAMIRALSM